MSSPAKPTVLLILDNHASSHRTLVAVDYACSHGTVILSLPPHTSHKLQPLDKTIFAPLKTLYNRACDNCLVSNHVNRISVHDIAGQFADAYTKYATVAKGVGSARLGYSHSIVAFSLMRSMHLH